MKRTVSLVLALAIVVLAVGPATPVAAVTAEEFLLRSGADLVALCATPATDPLYTAAVHMCHGFGAGSYQTLVALARHDRVTPLICPPDPAPTRNATVARFVEWARVNTQYLGDPPADTVGRFLLTEFPCSPKVAEETRR
jgi:hypothetical protein